MARGSSLALAVSIALAGSACSDDTTPIDAGISPSCMEAPNHSDLAWIQEKIFQPSCANFPACHMGAANDAAMLNLETGRSHAAMVNVASKGFPQFKLVVPGQPTESYLMIILGQYGTTNFIDPDVGTMPYNSGLLCQAKRDAIERWIAAGAPAESLDGGPPDAPTDAAPPLDAGVDAL